MTNDEIYKALQERFDHLDLEMKSIGRDQVQMKIQSALIKSDANRNTISIVNIKKDQKAIDKKVNIWTGALSVITITLPFLMKFLM